MKKAFALILIISTFTGFSQKISNKLHFQKGQNLEVTTKTNATSSMEMMGQSMQTTVTSIVTQNFSVTDANNNVATIDHKTKRIQFKADAMGQSQEFDSDKPEDLKGDVGKSLQPALDKKYTMSVDQKGVVISVKADTGTTIKPDDPMVSMLLGQLNISTEVPKVGDATLFRILPDHDISKGESWTDSSSADSGKKKTTYTVTDINNKEVDLDFTEESSLNTTQQIMGFDAKIKTESKGNGKIILDKSTGLLKQKTANIESKQTVEAQGQSIPSTSKMTIVTTVEKS